MLSDKPTSMANLLEELENIGLGEDEATVYAAGLELGPASVLELARKTGVNRTTLYAVLDRLLAERLFAKTIAGKKTLYVAEPPEKLKMLLQERLSTLNTVLPELLLLGRKGVFKPVMKYVEGIEGIKNVYRESLQSKEKAVFAFVGVERLTARSKVLNEFWENEYRIGRQNNGVHGKVIIPDNTEGRALKAKDATHNRESRMVPASTYNFEGEVLMYDNVVCFLSYTEDEEFALSLESKAITKTMKMIWSIVWTTGY